MERKGTTHRRRPSSSWFPAALPGKEGKQENTEGDPTWVASCWICSSSEPIITVYSVWNSSIATVFLKR